MGAMSLPPDFKEFLRSFHSRGVEYLLIGGHAVAIHGHSRLTNDLDVWIARSPANAERVLAALRDFGFSSLKLQPADLQQPDQVIQLGVAPLRIDILTSVSGVDFAECWPSRQEAVLDGVPVHVIDARSLKANKRATGRPRDLDDLERLP
jgi:predicted nucleotidyltransferase